MGTDKQLVIGANGFLDSHDAYHDGNGSLQGGAGIRLAPKTSTRIRARAARFYIDKNK